MKPLPRPGGRSLTVTQCVFVSVWAAAVVAGVLWVWDYKTTPGLASRPPAAWPASIALPRSGVTLVMTLHPLCPCSHASVSELARLMASIEQRLTVYALFVDLDPEKTDTRLSARIEDTPLWRRAAAIPEVTPIRDPHGAIAKAFASETSGDVIAYSANGELVFHGGVTAARGHEGDSFGRQRLLAVLRGKTPDVRTSPTFGCPLRGRAEQEVKQTSNASRSEFE